MSITSLSSHHVEEIEDILSIYAPGLTPRSIEKGIQSLYTPVLKYVNRYVPEEYNRDFEYMDTWESMIEDVMSRGSLGFFNTPSSSVKFEASNIVTPVKKIIGDLPIEESLPAYAGPLVYFKGIRVSFRSRVAIILTILFFLSVVMANDSSRQLVDDFVTSERTSFVQKVISGYMDRQRDSLKKKDVFGTIIG